MKNIIVLMTISIMLAYDHIHTYTEPRAALAAMPPTIELHKSLEIFSLSSTLSITTTFTRMGVDLL